MWLFVFWQGINDTTGAWNPFTTALGGEDGKKSIFPHLAFHADSTLALARTIFLYTVFTRGRKGQNLVKTGKPKSEASAGDQPAAEEQPRLVQSSIPAAQRARGGSAAKRR